MKCKQIKINLPDYLHNRLDPELRQTIAEHLTTCQDCSREFDFLRSYFGQLPNTEPITAPADFLVQVRLKTIDAKPERRWSFNIRLLPLAWTTTALALAGLIFFLYISPQPMHLSNTENNALSKQSPETISKALGSEPIQEQNAAQPLVSKSKKARPIIKPPQASTIQPALSELAVVLKVVEFTTTKSAANFELLKDAVTSTEKNLETKPAPSPVESKAPVDLKTRLFELIQGLDGQVDNETSDPGSNRLQKIIFTLPAVKYNELSAGLNNLGQATLPSYTLSTEDAALKIMLQLQYEP